jgi:hypothetical protein
MPKVPKRAERQIRLLGPLLLPLSLAVYLLLGAAAFLFLEHTNHEQTVRSIKYSCAHLTKSLILTLHDNFITLFPRFENGSSTWL